MYFCSVQWDLCSTASQGFPCCPVYFKICSQVWLVCIFLFSNWVCCEGPPCVKIGNELGRYPSFVQSIVCCHLWFMNYPSFGDVSTVCKNTVAILCMVLLRHVRLDLSGELFTKEVQLNFSMRLGACSVDNWQVIGVSAWEGLATEETLTCRFLSYHPRVMGLILTSSGIENICSGNWFDNNSFPDSFRCSPCVNKSLTDIKTCSPLK